MSDALIYRGFFMTTDDSQTVQIDIEDLSQRVGIPEDPFIVDMQMGANPLTINIIDNDNDKFTPIRSRNAVIEIITSNSTGIIHFTGKSDSNFLVTITTATKTLFTGYLVSADISQSFLPDKQTLVLTATDCLGLLKDIKLTDWYREVPSGPVQLIRLISYCLRKTNLALNIWVRNNVQHGTGTIDIDVANFSNGDSKIYFTSSEFGQFYTGQKIKCVSSGLNNNTIFEVVVNNFSEGTGTSNIQVTPAPVSEAGITNFQLIDQSSGHLYLKCYLDAKTFEADAGERENCYTVLEKILGHDCFVTQYNGAWHIVRIDEWDGNQIYYTEFDPDGVFIENKAATDYNKTIGSAEDLRLALADAIVKRRRPAQFTKLTLDYATPQEIPCNSFFERGDLTDTISAFEKHYDIECWQLYEDRPFVISTHAEAKIIKKFDSFGYEIERYIEISTVSGSHEQILISEKIPIEKNDKFQLNIDVAWDANLESANSLFNYQIAQILLYADDGTYYTLFGGYNESNRPYWQSCTSDFNTFQKEIYVTFNGTEDQTKWMTASIFGDCPPVPKSGYIKVALTHHYSNTTTKIRYANLQFKYYPFINGSNTLYTGQSQRVTKTDAMYLNKLDDKIFMCEAPTKLFKGALQILDGSVYKLATHFFASNVYPTNPPFNAIHPFSEIQIRSVFNQLNFHDWQIDGSAFGVDADWPDLIHKFIFTDLHPVTTDKYYMITGFSYNVKTRLINITFVQVYDSALGKTYVEERIFKYEV